MLSKNTLFSILNNIKQKTVSSYGIHFFSRKQKIILKNSYQISPKNYFKKQLLNKLIIIHK